MAGRTPFKDLFAVRALLAQTSCRAYGRSVEFTPRLKELLSPPIPAKDMPKPSNLPKLKDVKIPKKIERSPTDVLKALASTVGRDYTAPHYKFHDDPYLIPYSNMAKRSYALSKEAGRKAAKWVRQQHADIFMYGVSEPPVEAYFPAPVFAEDADVNEEDLKKYIGQGMLTESIQIYNILKAKGKAISDETRQAALELMCYSNENEPVDDDLIEERWYRQANFGHDRLKNTWRTGGLADTIFQEIETPNAAAYCAIIRGQAKFYSAEKAWVTYNEVKAKGLALDTETYNHLVKIANFLRENAELRMNLIDEILGEMKDQGVQPNLGTLNAIMESLSMMGNPREAKKVALATMAEFKILGIEPSLATYFFLLALFCKERGPVSTILKDIMREIRGKEFTMKDPKDTMFFVMAMDIARNHLQDLELAFQVDELLHTGNNYDLIGDSFKESVYYRHYMALRCGLQPFDDFMKFYAKIVPNIYTPEPGIMEEILKTVELNTAISYIPQLWSDMVIFDQSFRENLLALVLHIMAAYYPTDDFDVEQPKKLAAEFTDISWQIWETIEGQDREKSSRIVNWSGKMIGDLITIQVNGENFDNAGEVMKKLISPSAASQIVGVPSLESLRLFLDMAISNSNGAYCLACLQYMNECGFPEVRSFGEEVLEKVKLDILQTSKLCSIAGLEDRQLEIFEKSSK